MPCPLQYPSQRTFDYKVDWPAIPYPRLFKLCAHVHIEIDLLELLFVFCPCSKLAQKLWTTQLMCPLCVGEAQTKILDVWRCEWRRRMNMKRLKKKWMKVMNDGGDELLISPIIHSSPLSFIHLLKSFPIQSFHIYSPPPFTVSTIQ